MKKVAAFVIMIVVLISCTLPVIASDTSSVFIPVESSYTGVPESEELTYVLKADDISYPMPFGGEGGEKTITLLAGSEGNFGEIDYHRVGVYTYTVYQTDGRSEYCTYDNRVYKLTVTVVNGSDGIVAAAFFTSPDSGYKWEKAEFINQYYSSDGALTVVKSVNRGTVAPGDLLIYSLTVTNNGGTDLYGVRVRDYVPKYTLFQSINDSIGEFGSIDDHDHVTWFIPKLGAGESMVLSFTVLVDDCLPRGASVKNTALYTVTGSPTPVPPNDPPDPEISTNEVETPSPGYTPQTGDTSNLILYIVLGSVALAGLSFCIVMKRKIKKVLKEEIV